MHRCTYARPPAPKPRKFTAGIPDHSAIAFIAAFAVLFGILLVVGLFLKLLNPPRLEARHATLPVGVRPNVSRHRRPPSGVKNTMGHASASQANLLAPGSVQGYSQPPSNTVTTLSSYPNSQPAPYLHATQASSNVPLSNTTTSRSKARKSRALPAPPIGSYSDQKYRYSTGYADPYASSSQELSPFESQNEVAPVTTSRPSRLSRGYVPLPEPPVNNSSRDDRISYYDGALNYYNQPQSGPSTTYHYRTKSGSSQLSRVESIGAGDPRRHSKRGRNNSTRKMTTAERVRALREANLDAKDGSPSKGYTDGTTYEPYSDWGYQPTYANDSSYTNGAYAYVTDDYESQYYPVKEEYRYAAAPSSWDQQWYSQPSQYGQGYQQPMYQQHRYNPF